MFRSERLLVMVNKLQQGFILMMSIILVLACSAEDRKQKYIAQGESYFEQENYIKSRLEFKNALQIDPSDLDVRYRLGLVEEKTQNLQAALGHYRAVVATQAEHLGALKRLSRLHILYRDLSGAKTYVETLQELHDDSADTWSVLASYHSANKDDTKAIEFSQNALSKNPGHKDAAALLAGLYMKGQQRDKAIQVLEDLLTVEPIQTSLRALLADLYRERGHVQKGVELLSFAINQTPNTWLYRQQLINLLLRAELWDDAEEQFILAMGNPEIFKLAQKSYLDFLLEEKGETALVRYLKREIELQQDTAVLRLALADSYRRTQDHEQAEVAYRSLFSQGQDDSISLEARNHLSQMLTELGEIRAAKHLINDILSVQANNSEALFLRAQLVMQNVQSSTLDIEGDRHALLRSAITDLRAVLRLKPNDPLVLSSLARAHSANNELVLAKDYYAQALKYRHDSIEILDAYIDVLLRLKHTDLAIEQLEVAVGVSGDKVLYLNRLAQLQVSEQHWSGVESTIQALQDLETETVYAQYFSGLAAYQQGDHKLAEERWINALKKQATALEPLQGLIDIYTTHASFHTQNEKRLFSLIDKAAKQGLPKDITFYLKAKFYLAFTKTQVLQKKAQKWLQQAIIAAPKKPVYYEKLARFFIQKKDFNEAIAIYDQGIGMSANGATLLHIQRAELLVKLGKIDTAITQYNDLLLGFMTSLKGPKSKATAQGTMKGNDLIRISAANNLSLLLVNHRADLDSLKRAQALSADFEKSDNPILLDTYAWVAFKSGKSDAALKVLKKAVEKAPEAPTLNFHLGAVYAEQGQSILAKRYLDKALASSVDFAERLEAESLQKALSKTLSQVL